MLKIIMLLGSAYFIGTIVSFYSLNVPDVDNNMINFNHYRNKKILIVNTASNNGNVNQLTALQQLYLQHHDSVVVIAFPSNSFGNEPRSNSAIKTFMQQDYGITFPIAYKGDVTGNEASIVYKWLENKMQNGKTDTKTVGDFQKYLINKKGALVAVFDSSTVPDSQVLQDAIRNY